MSSYRSVESGTFTVGAATPVKVVDGTAGSYAGWRCFNNTGATLQFKVVPVGTVPVLVDFNGSTAYPSFENVLNGGRIEDGARGADVYCLSLGGSVTVHIEKVLS